MRLERGTPAMIDEWMALVMRVRWNFPGLETAEAIADHRKTVLKFISRGEALCVLDQSRIAGVMLVSAKHNMICCLAVAPEARRRGAATLLMNEALRCLDRTAPITVTTFREGDDKAPAPRALYRKYGFTEGEMMEEYGYPVQQLVLFPDCGRP